MSKWWIYDSVGTVTGGTIDCPVEHLFENIPDGCGCLIGPVNVQSQCVDMVTGEVVDYIPPAPSENHQWEPTAKRWVYVIPFEELKRKTLDDIDQLCDRARDSVVVSANRTSEYTRAQEHAEQYQASNWTLEPVPESVASWRDAKYRQEWTARQAAEDILAARDRWLTAVDFIRRLRLKAKEDVKAATLRHQPDMTLAVVEQTLATAMQGVQ